MQSGIFRRRVPTQKPYKSPCSPLQGEKQKPRRTEELKRTPCQDANLLAMGICSSCEATAVMPLATAKLVLEDGTLQEFSWPVKARHALGKDHRTCFVCSADDMEFDGFVSALGPDGELQLGQLYFVLPRSMLKHPLQPEDMAALAVKASAALMGSSARALDGQKCRLVFAAGTRGDAVEGHERALAEKMRRPRRPGSSGRYFRPALGAIDE